MRRFRSYALLILLPVVQGLRAQDLGFDIQPRLLELGQVAEITLTVMGSGQFQPPNIPAQNEYSIQYVGTERRFELVNGSGGQTTAFKYHLRPKQAGKIVVGPFQYNINGRIADIPAIEVQVAPQGQVPTEGQVQEQLKDLLFAQADIKSGTIFNQEVFDLTISVYYRGLNVARGIQLMGFPETGFTIKPLQELPGRREMLKNQVYEVARYRCKIHALTTGKFTFEPVARVALLVPRRRGGPAGDPFFDFDIDAFFGRSQRQEIDIKLPPLTIEISELPKEGQPEDFSGAVGQFRISAAVAPQELKAGDPLTLTTTIEGAGNIDSISAPDLGLGNDFKVYEAKLAAREIDEASSMGRKVFEQVIIPRTAGQIELPTVRFPYFDPIKQTYEVLQQGPFPLTVQAAPEAQAYSRQSPELAGTRQAVDYGNDIVYLKSSPGNPDRPGGLLFNVLINTPPFLLGVGAFLYRRRSDELRRDQGKARRRQAPQAARSGLKAASAAMATGDHRGFFEGLWEALNNYFGNRLNLPAGEINADRIAASARWIEPADLERLRDSFAACEDFRYGATRQIRQEEMESLLADVEQLLASFERKA